MYQPKITVIIPVYNTQDYLKECFDSILNQTYQNWELIIVDDGSTDKSPQICDYYDDLDERIKVIHKKNEGQGVGRNVALDISTGEYVMFVDSDDYVKLNMFETLVKYLQENRYDVIICGAQCKGEKSVWSPAIYDRVLEFENHDLMEFYVTKRIITGPVTKLFKSHLFKQIRFPNFRANEDAYIMHRLFGNCENGLVIPDVLYIQNIRDDSTEMRPFNKHKMHLLDCALTLRNYIDENYPSLSKYTLYRPVIEALKLIYWIIRDGCNKKNKKELAFLKSFCDDEYEKLKHHTEKNNKILFKLCMIKYLFTVYLFGQFMKAYKLHLINFLSKTKGKLMKKWNL